MIWDVSIRKYFADGKHPFTLDVQFCSDSHCLVLFGPSGAGKSQTLKMIAGLGTPDNGHIRVEDTVLFSREFNHGPRVNLPPQQRRLAYVFQDYALFPHLTVLQNIAFALQPGLLNPGRHPQHEAVDHWLRVFRLESVAYQFPAQLSGGQRQRTALARALVAQPRALLLDEPFAALDRSLRIHLRQELADLQAELAIPLILITHDEEDIEHFADTVIHIHEGRTLEKTRDESGHDELSA